MCDDLGRLIRYVSVCGDVDRRKTAGTNRTSKVTSKYAEVDIAGRGSDLPHNDAGTGSRRLPLSAAPVRHLRNTQYQVEESHL